MRTVRRTLAALLLGATLAGCAAVPTPPRAGAEPEIAYIDRDTSWGGEVRVGGVVHVRKAATLNIRPGARVIRNTPTGQTVLDVDMNDIIKRGQRDKAIMLMENDVVVVPESFF